MTDVIAEPAADTDGTWRAEFGALLLDIDRQAVALDVRCWLRPVPGDALSVIEHLQLLHQRWRAVLALAPSAFVPDSALAAARADRTVRAVRPAALLRTWRREGRAFPDRLEARYARAGGPSLDQAKRQYRAELSALHRCLAAVRAAGPAGPSRPDR
jgi:hypothetical protein